MGVREDYSTPALSSGDYKGNYFGNKDTILDSLTLLSDPFILVTL